MQMFCFPHAGGSASFFDDLAKELKASITVTALEYAGHGNRRKESYYLTLDEMAADLCAQLCEKYEKGEEIALFGYSMGTVVIMELYETLLSQTCLPKPKHIFLAAHYPFTQKALLQFMNPTMKDAVKEYVIKFGGIPKRLLLSDVFWRTYLPMYQHDFYLIGLYDFEKKQPRIDVPATVFFSADDTPREQMEKWEKYLMAGVDLIEYEGNHFFITQYYKNIATIIGQKLMNIY